MASSKQEITVAKGPQERDAQKVMILGRPRSGKSTLAEELLLESMKANTRALIIDDNGGEKIWRKYNYINLDSDRPNKLASLKGINRTMLPIDEKEHAKFWLDLYNYFNSAALLLDDVRAYIPKVIPEGLGRILRRARQKELDVFIVAHGWMEAPARLFTFPTTYYLFATNDEIGNRKEFVSHADKMEKIKRWVDYKAGLEPHYVKEVIVDELPFYQ